MVDDLIDIRTHQYTSTQFSRKSDSKYFILHLTAPNKIKVNPINFIPLKWILIHEFYITDQEIIVLIRSVLVHTYTPFFHRNTVRKPSSNRYSLTPTEVQDPV